MRAFMCKRCHELVSFEAQACGHCGGAVGFEPASGSLEALGEGGRDLAMAPGARWVRCQRAQLLGCNWLVPTTDKGQPCLSCRLTLKLPPLKRPEYREALSKAEQAKRRLIYQLLQLKLPIETREEDRGRGLAFELLASSRHVVTGHHNGVITIDLNETNDAFREQTRAEFGEPYRTLLGHFRHEIGHYYWKRLICEGDGPGGTGQVLGEARSIFGDERADYEAARRLHYARSARAEDWRENYVSAYAAMHPFEDWAETFAHYLHIWDAVQTAASFGVLVVGPVDDRTGRRDPAKASVPSEETAALEGFDAVIADWRPLTLALNALNRSLGKDDLYPFELPSKVTAKLAFVHKVITDASLARL
jgi:hypothetical protein